MKMKIRKIALYIASNLAGLILIGGLYTCAYLSDERAIKIYKTFLTLAGLILIIGLSLFPYYVRLIALQ